MQESSRFSQEKLIPLSSQKIFRFSQKRELKTKLEIIFMSRFFSRICKGTQGKEAFLTNVNRFPKWKNQQRTEELQKIYIFYKFIWQIFAWWICFESLEGIRTHVDYFFQFDISFKATLFFGRLNFFYVSGLSERSWLMKLIFRFHFYYILGALFCRAKSTVGTFW